MKVKSVDGYMTVKHTELHELIEDALSGCSWDGGALEEIQTECTNLQVTLAKLIEFLVESSVISLQDIDKIVHGNTHKIGNLSLDE